MCVQQKNMHTTTFIPQAMVAPPNSMTTVGVVDGQVTCRNSDTGRSASSTDRSLVVLDQRASDLEFLPHVIDACDVRRHHLFDPVASTQVDAVGAFGLGEIDIPSRMLCRCLRLSRAGDLRGLRQECIVFRRPDFRCNCRLSCRFRCNCRLSRRCRSSCGHPLLFRGFLRLVLRASPLRFGCCTFFVIRRRGKNLRKAPSRLRSTIVESAIGGGSSCPTLAQPSFSLRLASLSWHGSKQLGGIPPENIGAGELPDATDEKLPLRCGDTRGV